MIQYDVSDDMRLSEQFSDITMNEVIDIPICYDINTQFAKGCC